MRPRTFFILLFMCAVLAGVSWFMLQPGSSPGRKTDDKTGARLLAALPVNDIRRIDITGPESRTVLEKGTEVWGVKNRFGYPADFPKLSQFVLTLRDLKIDRTFPASEEILSRLSLHPPSAPGGAAKEDTAGIQVTLKGPDDQTFADIIIGKPRESDAGQGGNFVMPAGENTVYVVDQAFRFLDTDAGHWIDRQLADIPPEQVARVDRIDQGTDAPRYTVQRPGEGEPAALMDVPDGRKVVPAKINRLMDALASFRVEDVIDPGTPAETTGLNNGPCFRYTLFEGTVYTLCLGNTVAGNPDQIYLRASVGFTAPPPAEKATADTADAAPAMENDSGKTAQSAAEASKAPADPALAAAKKNKQISPWIFSIPQWRADQLISDRADLLEPPEQTEE